MKKVKKLPIKFVYDPFQNSKHFKFEWPVTRAYAEICEFNPNSDEFNSVTVTVLRKLDMAQIKESFGKATIVGNKGSTKVIVKLKAVRLSTPSFTLWDEIKFGVLVRTLRFLEKLMKKYN